ncbi:DUF177 domain-containing protein [Celeribacter naphthalenivorans]|uniref:DUF177 domain-containing protein n=1 Tax=Celeribacter naphthalenivorans TaxID=1614694 RepID=UPI001CFABA4B|nr:DUF177 domain-containing protein [Celeribacter naphthalenivorans]
MIDTKYSGVLTCTVGRQPVTGDFDKAIADNGVEDVVKTCCEFFVSALKKLGYDCSVYEEFFDEEFIDEEPLPSINELPPSDDRFLVQGDWFNLEDLIYDNDYFPILVRIPPMSAEEFGKCCSVISKVVCATFEEDLEAAICNDLALPTEITLSGPRFDMSRFVSIFPEAAILFKERRLEDFRTTTFRQQMGSRILRDLRLLGRDKIGVGSIKNSMSKMLNLRSSAAKHQRFGDDWVLTLDHFDTIRFLFEADDKKISDFLKGISDACVIKDQLGSKGMTPNTDPAIEFMLDRLAIAAAWVENLGPRLSFAGDFHSEFATQEKGMTYVAFLDDEPVMMISDSSGWVCIPDLSGESGEHMLRADGFSISDIDTIIPLFGLDLAEILIVCDLEVEDLPIRSRAFAAEVGVLATMLVESGLFKSGQLDEFVN